MLFFSQRNPSLFVGNNPAEEDCDGIISDFISSALAKRNTVRKAGRLTAPHRPTDEGRPLVADMTLSGNALMNELSIDDTG